MLIDIFQLNHHERVIQIIALVLKSAWKALADPLSLLHDIIATPAKIHRQLQPPTRKSARLNLAPTLVVEQRLSSRKPFQRAAQTLLANLGEACPVSANQRKTMSDIFVLDIWKRSWRENYAWPWREYFPTPNLDPLKPDGHHESDRMVAFQSTAIGAHQAGCRNAQIWDCDFTCM